ncbi:copper resistance protein CopD [Aeromicrobium phragmitis]|uniref:Copper resistance protein CopD n=1 Tax=Aeromicrobium phragmitis TaxID=2478914 RepID=A0A3L8PLY1_9ACTN|nr:cytochrome c oxidase assembly protein [Aeromicrobium phragmitis]RLV56270.1 copper resistance protein CopD [Aeromicrobium phragmitis]
MTSRQTAETRVLPALPPRLTLAVMSVGALAAAIIVMTAFGPDSGSRLPATLTHLAAMAAAVLTCGLLLAAGWLLPLHGRSLSAAALRLCRMSTAMALVAALAAVTHVVIDVSTFLDVSPAAAVTSDAFWTLLAEVRAYRGDLGQAALALLAGALALAVRRPAETLVPLGLALLSTALPAIVGHAASGHRHVLGTMSMAAHAWAAALWVGGLAAVVIGARLVPTADTALVRRFSRLALGCFLTVAASGLLSAALQLNGPRDLLTTDYGVVLTAKIAALVGLGCLGLIHRRRVIQAPSRSSGDFAALAALELLIMGAAMGLAAGLTAVQPPSASAATQPGSAAEAILGYALDAPPTPATLLLPVHLDPFGLLVTVLVGVPYVAGVLTLRRRGDQWPWHRSLAFGAGVLLIVLVTCTGTGRYAAALLSVHMAQHMTLNMIAPVLLALGAPITLALRALPPAGRRTLLAAMRSRVGRFLTLPIVATAIFVGGLYGLYFTPLFELAMSHHWGHLLMQAHFLASGFLYYWMVLGVDPDPRRSSRLLHIPMLVLVMLTHTIFAVVLVFGGTPIGGDYFDSLQLDWARPLLDDQALAGGIAWAVGEFVTIAVLAGLILRWFADADRADRRQRERRRPQGTERR